MDPADSELKYAISYGKVRVPVYRVSAASDYVVARIAESDFTGRTNALFALEVDVEVFGDNFLPSYTVGDNSSVVATDSMKNFVLQQALDFDGTTIESFLNLLGRRFLSSYSQMERVRVTGRELPFAAVRVPADESAVFVESDVVLSRTHDDFTMAMLEFYRSGEHIALDTHRCGRIDLELLKVTGSSFDHFVRDEFTTLPERADRPLFIHLDVFWQYDNAETMFTPGAPGYVSAMQVRDVVATVFHQFVSQSIQHLVHEMGQRLLARFPQMRTITLVAQNQTPDPAAISTQDSRVKVYTSPFSAYGLIQLTLERS